jgi:hypothetical protein
VLEPPGRGPDDDLALARLLDGLGAGGVPDHQGLGRGRDGADPAQAGGVELDARQSDRLRGRQGRLHQQHIGAVLRGLIVEIVENLEPAGAGHVLGHGRGIAWKLPTDVLGEQSCQQIVFAADRHADQHGQGLAPVEFGD